MIAPMIRTMPIMLNTELPVLDVLLIALQATGCDALVGIWLTVTKNANTPTARIINDTTTPMIAPGSIKPNVAFITSCTSFYF